MSATAILQCRPNSHPFPDRSLILGEPLKIGRSVARSRPAANNAIFDCKVLSRNHALLFYENGKFFLKDTKSSNGTFVNNYRLSKGSEESVPQEVCSGDVVQFGVDVLENSKKGAVTHGCIIATLKLYLPDGQEAKPSGMCYISSQEIFQLKTSLQEAQHREKLIETKLANFQQIVVSIQEAASEGWSAMIDEDRLLQRLEMLEDQLTVYSKNSSEDILKEEIQRILSEKNLYETTAKESLKRILHEKVEAAHRCLELERSLSHTETELKHKRECAEVSKKELEELLCKQSTQAIELQNMANQLKKTEEEFMQSKNLSETEKFEFEQKLKEKTAREAGLTLQIERLQKDHETAVKQLDALKSKYENIKNGRIKLASSPVLDFKKLNLSEDDLTKALELFKETVSALHQRLWQSQDELEQTQASITQLQSDVDKASDVEQICQNKKLQLQDDVFDTKSKLETRSALSDHLRNELDVFESRLKEISADSEKIYDELYDSTETLCRTKKDQKSIIINSSSDALETTILANDLDNLANELDKCPENKKRFINSETEFILKDDIFKIKEKLEESEKEKMSLEKNLRRLEDELNCSNMECVTAVHESANLQNQLGANQLVLMEKRSYVNTLQEIWEELNSATHFIYSNIEAFAEKLRQQKCAVKELQTENQDLNEKLSKTEELSQISLEQVEILRAKLNTIERNNGPDIFALSGIYDTSINSSHDSSSPYSKKFLNTVENTLNTIENILEADSSKKSSLITTDSGIGSSLTTDSGKTSSLITDSGKSSSLITDSDAIYLDDNGPLTLTPAVGSYLSFETSLNKLDANNKSDTDLNKPDIESTEKIDLKSEIKKEILYTNSVQNIESKYELPNVVQEIKVCSDSKEGIFHKQDALSRNEKDYFEKKEVLSQINDVLPENKEFSPQKNEVLSEKKKILLQINEVPKMVSDSDGDGWNSLDGEEEIVENGEDMTSSESVLKLKTKLKLLLRQHEKLRRDFILANEQFTELDLQNKMVLPTWLLLLLMVFLSVGWQWFFEWL